MTFVNIPSESYARPTFLHGLAKQLSRWRDQRRLAKARRMIPDLPDHLLKDVGLEHLRDLKTDPTFWHRML